MKKKKKKSVERRKENMEEKRVLVTQLGQGEKLCTFILIDIWEIIKKNKKKMHFSIITGLSLNFWAGTIVSEHLSTTGQYAAV